MTPETLFDLVNHPLPGHDFKDSLLTCYSCALETKKQDTRLPAIVMKLELLPGCDRQVLKAARRLFSLVEMNHELPSNTPYFNFIKLFCIGRGQPEGGARLYTSSVWAGKVRLRHALMVYSERLKAS